MLYIGAFIENPFKRGLPAASKCSFHVFSFSELQETTHYKDLQTTKNSKYSSSNKDDMVVFIYGRFIWILEDPLTDPRGSPTRSSRILYQILEDLMINFYRESLFCVG